MKLLLGERLAPFQLAALNDPCVVSDLILRMAPAGGLLRGLHVSVCHCCFLLLRVGSRFSRVEYTVPFMKVF